MENSPLLTVKQEAEEEEEEEDVVDMYPGHFLVADEGRINIDFDLFERKIKSEDNRQEQPLLEVVGH